jgi:hypothetical protein
MESDMRRMLESRSLWFKSGVLASVWLVVSALFMAVAYLRNGPSGALNKFHEVLFCSIVFLFLGPALVLGQRLERRLRAGFPVGAPFLAIAATLVPSLVVGLWVAVLALRGLRQGW